MGSGKKSLSILFIFVSCLLFSANYTNPYYIFRMGYSVGYKANFFYKRAKRNISYPKWLIDQKKKIRYIDQQLKLKGAFISGWQRGVIDYENRDKIVSYMIEKEITIYITMFENMIERECDKRNSENKKMWRIDQ